MSLKPSEEVSAPQVAVAQAPTPGFGDIPVLLFIRGLALISLMVAVVLSLHWYIGLRLVSDLKLQGLGNTMLWAALWSCFGSIFLGFIGGRLLPRRLAKLFQWVGFGWMGAFGLLLTGLVATDVGLWLAALVRGGAVEDFWRQARAVGVLGVVPGLLAWGFFVARRPLLKRLDVPIEGLASELDGFCIAQLSDVHIGETLDRRFALRLVDQVNALDVDLIAVTGDLIDGSPEKLRDDVAPFAQLKAKHGVFYVTGNHEYYHGGAAWEAECRQLGMRVLHNEHRVIGSGSARLVIAGVPDVEGARFSQDHAPRADVAFAHAPAGVPRLLLAHQPRFARRAQPHSVALMLSGHTHGGQMFPFMFLVRLQQPVIAGLKVIEGVLTYTSTGTGYWGPPFRIGTRGEVTLIRLRVERSVKRRQS